jgi:hypothetical protein
MSDVMGTDEQSIFTSAFVHCQCNNGNLLVFFDIVSAFDCFS